jgi:hypothetical protein
MICEQGWNAVGLFRPYKQAETAEPVTETKVAGTPKNRPTPTRQQALAAREATLHPKLTPRQARAADAAARNKRQAQQAQAVDNQPARVLLRNYIDARWSIAEFLWPVLLLLLIGSFAFGGNLTVVYSITVGLWAMLIVSVFNFVWSYQGFRAELGRRYPGTTTKGLMLPFVARMMMIRRMRQPPPVIARGADY